MNYNISYFSEGDFNLHKEINCEEFDRLMKLKDFIIFLYSIEQLFDFLKQNIFEFWSFYFEVVEKYRFRIIANDDGLHEAASKFNVKLANILTSFRTYEDHVKNKISNSDFDSNIALEYYEEKQSYVYDKYLSFRFFTRLRNYLQHFDLPITNVIFNTKLIEEDNIKYSLRLMISKSALLKYNGWSTVKDEIIELNDKIDIKEYLNEFLHSVSVLHKFIRTFYLNYFWDVEQELNLIKEECVEKNFVTYLKRPDTLSICLIQTDKDSKAKERYWLPIKRLSDIRMFFGKNEFGENFIKTFSTNLDTD